MKDEGVMMNEEKRFKTFLFLSRVQSLSHYLSPSAFRLALSSLIPHPSSLFTRRRVALLLLAALTSSLLSGCIAARRTPNLERIFADARGRAGKRPIIIIPGLLGSELVNYETGEVVWPSAFRSSDDGLSLPVSPDLAGNRDNLVARKIVNTIKLARLVPEIFIYRDLLDTLNKYGGYTEGDWNNPKADGDHDTFYVFPYDWRRDNVETARDFLQRVETLKRKLNRPDLRFNIVADSMGGLVARYAAMYGEAELPPEGTTPAPTWAGAVHINKIIMFGTPNEGSANAFATTLEGYSITEGLRRRIPLFNKLSREDVFTCPSIFQVMPHNNSVRFLDENLQPLAVDLYDPSTWKRYGWSAVADPDYRERFVAGRIRGDNAPISRGSLENLDAYFAAALLRAKHFHEALDVTTEGDAPVPLFAFGGDCEETLLAPIILRDEKTNSWVTLTSPRAYRTSTGRRISREEATRAMYAPGDGRVTRRSLLAEDLASKRRRSTIFDTGLPIVYATFACDLHGDLQHNKTLQDNALTALVSEAIK
jgi:pimeloyl-ACP methyl ester carboxylesterase